MPRVRAARPGGPKTFDRIYAVVATIPPGRVATYGDVAAAAGGACTGRIVGFAMRAAPGKLRLPCHRVVNRLGDMAPISGFGGPDRQRRMLKREGVAFRPNGRIDLGRSRHDWHAACRREG